MTEHDAFMYLVEDNKRCLAGCEGAWSEIKDGICACGDALIASAIEELNQYRATGTLDECMKSVRLVKSAREALRKFLCSEEEPSC